ncbi:MAG: chemotaxis protein CheY [Sulfurovum sp. AS07-7]|nr:MAG: chemotaxis protein CheY [Sulfurovum sp. AS07-7]
MINILMIEDDTEFAEILSDYLSRFDIKTTNYEDPFLGLSAGITKYDLILLDLTLPGIDGLEVCKEIRQRYNIPIIISSARVDIKDKLEALNLGADDYLPKPYDPQELYARILSLLRRHNNDFEKIPKKDSDIQIKDNCIYFNDKQITLTPAEYEVFSILLKNRGITQSREYILNNAPSMNIDSSAKSLDVIISKIRSKLDNIGKIKSVRGIGYKLL